MRAALLTKFNAPLEMVDLFCYTPLRYGQVMVKVLVSGICGAQLQEITGQKKGGPLPHPLGHEGCGIVEEIGPGVSHVKVGDKVVMHWRKGAGIESNFPKYVITKTPATAAIAGGAQPEGVMDNWTCITGGKVTTFSQYAVCSENRLTAVPMDTPEELCALLGCGLSTALATLENEAALRRGESILIVGCGGLGANLILAARMTHASPIIVTDIVDKAYVACLLGVSEFWKFDAPEFMGGKTRRFDVIIETSGASVAIQATLPLLAPGGRYIMVGQPKPGQEVVINNAFHFFEAGSQYCKSLRATQGGAYQPHQDIPRYLAAFRDGNLPLRGMVSNRVPLEQINDGIDLVKRGMASRVMVEMFPAKEKYPD